MELGGLTRKSTLTGAGCGAHTCGSVSANSAPRRRQCRLSPWVTVVMFSSLLDVGDRDRIQPRVLESRGPWLGCATWAGA